MDIKKIGIKNVERTCQRCQQAVLLKLWKGAIEVRILRIAQWKHNALSQ